MAASTSPLPKPISTCTGAFRPKSAQRSSGASPASTPYLGQSSVSARSCAFVIRPSRRTKLRIGLRGLAAKVIYEFLTQRRKGREEKRSGAARRKPYRPTLYFFARFASLRQIILKKRPAEGRGRRAVLFARHAPGEIGLAPGRDRFFHGARHEHRVLRQRDRGVHEHAVAAQFHRNRRVARRAHTGVH